MVNLYLDGCSFTYGLGLDNKKTLAARFTAAGYNVLNLSRPGKSNFAIAQDTYNNFDKANIFVLGFSFSARYHIRYDNLDIDILPSNYTWQYDLDKKQGLDIDHVVKNLHKNFYTLFDQQHFSNISDMIVDTTIDSMKLNNKKFFVFSWETRRTKNELYYPIVNCGDRLEDGHLNSNGTKKLFDKIQEQLGSP